MKTLPALMLVLAFASPGLAQQPASAPATTSPQAVADAQASPEQLLAKLADLQADLRNCTGSKFVSDKLNIRTEQVIAQLDHLDVELSEKRARADLTARKIDELTTQAKGKIANDHLLKELESLATQRAADAEQFKKMAASGVAAMADASQAIAAATEARIKVDERREAIIASIGGGIIPALNRDLVTLSIDADAIEQTRNTLQKKRDELQRAFEISMEILNVYGHLPPNRQNFTVSQ